MSLSLAVRVCYTSAFNVSFFHSNPSKESLVDLHAGVIMFDHFAGRQTWSRVRQRTCRRHSRGRPTSRRRQASRSREHRFRRGRVRRQKRRRTFRDRRWKRDGQFSVLPPLPPDFRRRGVAQESRRERQPRKGRGRVEAVAKLLRLRRMLAWIRSTKSQTFSYLPANFIIWKLSVGTLSPLCRWWVGLEKLTKIIYLK